MPKSGISTKENILNCAESLVLSYGFAGASIDRVIGKAGITKGTFFYHFKNKADLAKTLIHRFHKKDQKVFGELMARAERLSSEPLQQFQIFVGLMAEMFDQLTEPFPGCLFAAYVYQRQQFEDEVMCVCSNAMLDWRAMFGAKIRAILEKHEPRQPIDADSLADLFTSVLEGALLISKTMKDPKLVAPQLEHYRKYLTALFQD